MLIYILPFPLSFSLSLPSREITQNARIKKNTIPEGFGNSVPKIRFSYLSFIKVPYAFELENIFLTDEIIKVHIVLSSLEPLEKSHNS